MTKKNLTENELYPPVKQLFENKGFTVKGEVNHCDLVAVSNSGTLLVVELKTNLNLELFLQGMDRFLLTDQVYLAFPLPKTTQKSAVWNRKRHSVIRLCRRIGMGLIGVHFNRVKQPYASIILEPGPYLPRKNYAKSRALLKEFDRREGDFNLGGVSQTPIVTAYRQEALICAQLLKMHGPLKISVLKQLGASQNAGNILSANHYNWFEKVGHGTYRVTSAGLAGLDEFKIVVDNIQIKPE